MTSVPCKLRSTLFALILATNAAACRSELARHVTEPEANAIIARLSDNEIEASKEAEHGGTGERYSIFVFDEDLAAATKMLTTEPRFADLAAAHAAPQPPSTRLIPTETEEYAKLHDQLERKLARSIQLLPGVTFAVVHLGRNLNQPAMSASVLVHTQSRASGAFDSKKAQQLMAGAVPGLLTDNISVVRVSQPGLAPHHKIGGRGWIRRSPLRIVAVISMIVNVLLATLVLSKPIKKLRRRFKSD
jgi:type III secretory pathway lipoprotein EscJ